MSFVTISYCLDRDSGAIASIEPSVSLLYIWIAKMGNVGEEEVAVRCRKDLGVKHEMFQKEMETICISVLAFRTSLLET